MAIEYRRKLKKIKAKVKLKIQPRLNRIASKFEAKFTRALSTPESRKQRNKRIRRIFMFAITSAAIGSVIYFYPPATKFVVSSTTRLKSTISELFSSANLEPDPTLENAPLPLETSKSSRISRRALIVLVTIATGLIIKFGPSIVSSFDSPGEAGTEATVRSVADTPADYSTCGIGPEDWPSWARILLHLTVQTVSIVYGSVHWDWAELARAEQAAEAAKLAAQIVEQIK